MPDTVIYLDQTDRIEALYQQYDKNQESNLVTLNAPLCQNVLGMIEDVQALLEDPQTRPIAEPILRKALNIIAGNIIDKPK